MKIHSFFLAAFLLILAVAAGLLLPRGMAWFQSVTAPQTLEYEVETVELEYSQEMPLIEKYAAIRPVDKSYGLVEAGHSSSDAEIEEIVRQFLQNAFPHIDLTGEQELQPALIVTGGQVLTVWHYRYLFNSESEGIGFVLELMVDDATGAVLNLSIGASQSGLLPVLGSLYGLPADYWLQMPDLTHLMQLMAEHFKQALEYGQDGLIVTPIADYDFVSEMPGDYMEPIYFSQLLILEQQDAFIDVDLRAEDHQLYFNCY